MIFWEHSKRISPRPVGLHLEGILSAAMATRLHFEYGWPAEQLGFEYPPGARIPGRRAFDLAALNLSDDLALAGEAKNSRDDLDYLFDVMHRCSQMGEHQHPRGDPSQNGHNKWMGLLRCRPRIFFTYGPGEDWDIFEMTYGAEGTLSFIKSSRDLLRF